MKSESQTLKLEVIAAVKAYVTECQTARSDPAWNGSPLLVDQAQAPGLEIYWLLLWISGSLGSEKPNHFLKTELFLKLSDADATAVVSAARAARRKAAKFGAAPLPLIKYSKPEMTLRYYFPQKELSGGGKCDGALPPSAAKMPRRQGTLHESASAVDVPVGYCCPGLVTTSPLVRDQTPSRVEKHIQEFGPRSEHCSLQNNSGSSGGDQ